MYSQGSFTYAGTSTFEEEISDDGSDTVMEGGDNKDGDQDFVVEEEEEENNDDEKKEYTVCSSQLQEGRMSTRGTYKRKMNEKQHGRRVSYSPQAKQAKQAPVGTTAPTTTRAAAAAAAVAAFTMTDNGDDAYVDETVTTTLRSNVDRFDAQWTEKYDRLVKYKKQNNSTCVPISYTADPQLAYWVKIQRANCNKLTAERKHQLDSIGFVWDVFDALWTEMYERLVAYNNQYNSTCVPKSYTTDSQLANWVRRQRANCKKITAEKKHQLDSIGFVWNPNDAKWTEKYDRLVKCKKQKKSSTWVPFYYADDPPLGAWVVNQRYYYKKNETRLTADRISRLNSIGFVWSLRDAQSPQFTTPPNDTFPKATATVSVPDPATVAAASSPPDASTSTHTKNTNITAMVGNSTPSVIVAATANNVPPQQHVLPPPPLAVKGTANTTTTTTTTTNTNTIVQVPQPPPPPSPPVLFSDHDIEEPLTTTTTTTTISRQKKQKNMTSDTVTTVAAVSLGRSDKKKNEASLIELSPSPPPNRVTAHSRLVQNVSPRGICPIGDLNENDVLCGGGFVSNNYPGNKQFKDIIHSKQSQYLDPSTKKFEKAHIAAEIVTKIRARNPAGRFLKHDKDKRLWFDIGDAKAIKKTGQALREGAPNIRAPAYGNVSICNDASTVGDNSILVQNFPSQRRLQQLEQMNQSSNNAIPRIIASVSFFSKTETGEKIPHKFDKTVVDEFEDAIVDDDDGKKPAATQPRLPMSFIAANTDSTSKEKNTATITQITDGNGETMTDDGQGGHSTSNGMPLAPYGGDDVRYNSDGMPLFPGQEYRHRYLSFVAEDAAAVAATGANDDVQNITQV